MNSNDFAVRLMRKSTKRQSLSGADSARLFNHVVITQIEAQTIGQTHSSQRVAPEKYLRWGYGAWLSASVGARRKRHLRGVRREGLPMSKKSEES